MNILNEVNSFSCGYKYNSKYKPDIIITSHGHTLSRQYKTIFFYENHFNSSSNIIAYAVKTPKDFEELALKHSISRNRIIFYEHIDEFIFYYFNKYKYQFNSKKIELSKLSYCNNSIKIDTESSPVIIHSDMRKDEHCYLLYTEEIKLPKVNASYEIGLIGNHDATCEANLNMRTRSGLIEIDNEQIHINKTILYRNVQSDSLILSVRIKGNGLIRIEGIIFRETEYSGTSSDYLVLTNVYPSYDNIYRNGFVHRRVRNYLKYSIGCDVFTLSTNKYIGQYEYDGVNVYFGDEKVLLDRIKDNKYKKILVHFIDNRMLEVIQDSQFKHEVIVWIHGIEALSYVNRLCNFVNASRQVMNALKAQDSKKKRLLQRLISADNIKMIFVSNWLRDTVENDYQIKFLDTKIIPNVIDDAIFTYKGKKANDRLKVLSIRPFTARNYANDLTIAAIQELKDDICFNQFQFTIIGHGPLYEKLTQGVESLPNVTLINRFLHQSEIADYHRRNGVLLCPTRADTQGVTIGEAMSSGLVPITNRIQAIPEFVPDECGLVVEPESASELANAMKEIYNNPEKYLLMSRKSSKYIQAKCAVDKVIAQEIKEILE